LNIEYCMSQPLTLQEVIPEDVVIEFLDTLQLQYNNRVERISKGSYGIGFRITIMDPAINPFKTFKIERGGETIRYVDGSQRVTVDRIKDTTGIGRDRHLPEDIIFMKLVPISDPNKTNRYSFVSQVKFTEPNVKPIMMTTSTSTAFNNECNKQMDSYAKTNNNLNSVCMPLFYHKVIDSDDGVAGVAGVDVHNDEYNSFMKYVLSTTGISFDRKIKYGIAFMPYSVNFDTEEYGMTERSMRDIEEHVISPEAVLRNITAISSLPDHSEITIQTVFSTNMGIYLFICIVSLLIRLYLAGYCHGDLHSKNIMMYGGISSIAANNRRVPVESPLGFNHGGCLLIDWGFSWRHNRKLPPVLDYAAFSVIIQYIVTIGPSKGKHMLEWPSYFWFAAMFYDNVFPQPPLQPPLQPAFNNARCTAIFALFQYFEIYRSNYETSQLELLQVLAPGIIDSYYRPSNTEISQSVDAYIASLPPSDPERRLSLFNIHGGRRRRIYNAIKRKQTKNTKKHSRHRNRSLTRSRRSRHSRCCPTKLK
jgi:hypothetical protein